MAKAKKVEDVTLEELEQEEAATEEAETEESAKAPAQDIVRGRWSPALVWVCKFKFTETADSETANMFRTTPGKINDIRKDRNFGYVTEDMTFTKEDIDRAVAHVEGFDGSDGADAILEALGEMTADENSTLKDARASVRKTRGDGEPKSNRKSESAKKAAQEEVQAEVEADEEAAGEELEDLV